MQLELWHGTNQHFDRFDPAMLGLHTSNHASRAAFFFATGFETARDYALAAARKLVPDAAAHEARVRELLDRAEHAVTRGQHDLYERLVLEAEKLECRAMQAEPAGAAVLACRVRVENPFEIEGADRRVVTDLGAVLEDAREAGHDAVILRGIHDTPTGAGESDDHVAIFDVTKIDILTRFEVSGEPVPAYEPTAELAEFGFA